MRKRYHGNVSTDSPPGPICWLCGFTVLDPTNSANVHKHCAGKKVETMRSVHRTWFQGSFALETSLIRVARDWMGPNWKGVLS